MGGDDFKRPSKHKHRHRDKDEREYKSKRKHKHDKESGSSRKRSRKDDGDKLHIVDDDTNDEDMWVEKNIDMEGEVVRGLSLGMLDYHSQ